MVTTMRLKELLNENTMAAAPALVIPEKDGALRCVACGHRCLIREGKAGICHVRFNRAGELRVPGGYVEPTDAACELVLEALPPVEAELRRSLELAFMPAARQTLLGLLAGLHRRRSPRDGTVLGHAGEDMTLEHAEWLVDEAARAGLELDADDLESHCPDWQLTTA